MRFFAPTCRRTVAAVNVQANPAVNRTPRKRAAGYLGSLGVELVAAAMRKQYHFRPGPNGLRAWDVDRLVALTKNLRREQVPLVSIREIDEPYWSTGYEHAPTCRDVVEHARLIEEADLAFPVILSSDGRVMDGMH